MRMLAAAVVIALFALAAFLLLQKGVVKSGFLVESFPEEEFFNHSVHFCAWDDCGGILSSALGAAKVSVKCAFYRADAYVFGNISAATGEIVLDKKAKTSDSGNAVVYKANSRGIMHSKYCVIDSITVITGSFNPTNSARGDYNNLVIINSTVLAAFYGTNFESLKGRKAVAARKGVLLDDSLVEVYFCPYDDCVKAVKREIAMANGSVMFASYSFTHPGIANELIIKAAENVTITGVMEKSGSGSEYSKYAVMAANGINVRLEQSRRLMHHKFFVIDNETVITGSFNPTRNAAERNDENIIIIRNGNIAAEYAEEFWRVFESSD
ncbi:DUF1669 domain-containing protein [Candidatus Woesearchaeota archaeon]|nr:DUF1669 domain-containing protein [Candidatus Woesearchaeota archaeon]